MKEPAPDTEGSNVPVAALVIPAPLHVPPGTDAVRFVAGLVIQKGPAGVIVALGAELTVIEVVFVSLQPPIVIE